MLADIRGTCRCGQSVDVTIDVAGMIRSRLPGIVSGLVSRRIDSWLAQGSTTTLDAICGKCGHRMQLTVTGKQILGGMW
jgi:hypothetical protein